MKTAKSVAEAAAILADDPTVKDAIEQECEKSGLVTTLINQRLSKGMTQKDVAAAVGCSPSKISRIESGVDMDLSIQDLAVYSHAIGYDASITLHDQHAPVSAAIKSCVMQLGVLLERLTELAEGDSDLISGVNNFRGEALFNIMMRYIDSEPEVNQVLQIGEKHSSTQETANISQDDPAIC